MRAGELRHRICFQRKNETRNETGETLLEWQEIKICWGDVRPISGREILASNALQSQTTHRVYVRYFPGIDSADRIAIGHNADRYLNIQSIINSFERNRLVEILAIEGRGDDGPLVQTS